MPIVAHLPLCFCRIHIKHGHQHRPIFFASQTLIVEPLIISQHTIKMFLCLRGHNAVKAYQAFFNDPQLLARLKEEKLKIDLLFIDGDHSYDMVISYFESFAPFVNPGGWIVFDDYMDHKHSPEVQPAVNDLRKRLRGAKSIWFWDLCQILNGSQKGMAAS